MNTRSITLIVTFTAIAIALNTFRVPTIYFPGLFYSVYEIPVVVAFLLFGLKIGVLVEVLHIAGQLALFPLGPLGFALYPVGFVAMLVMLFGVYVASRFMTRKVASGKPLDGKKATIYLTAFAVASRGGIMPFFDYGVVYHILLPLVLGISFPEAYIVALVPGFVLFNVTAPLYTVPIAYIIATKVSRYLKIEPRLLRQV